MKASEKIAKFEDQLIRELITPADFVSEVQRVVDEVIREHSINAGEVWYAEDKYGVGASFLVRKVSYQDELVLWRLGASPSHCSLDWWTSNEGYTGWVKTISAA